MRRSLRKVKTSEGIGESPSFQNIQGNKVKLSSVHTAVNDEKPPAKRMKVRHNIAASPHLMSDSFLSARSTENIMRPTTPIDAIKTSQKKSRKVVPTVKSTASSVETNTTSQSKVLTLDKNSIESENDRKNSIESHNDTKNSIESHNDTKNSIESHDDSKENVCEHFASDSDQDDLHYYLQLRELNKKANEDFFNSIGMSQAKEQLSTTKKKAQPSKRGLQVKKEPQEPLLSRHSLRIRRIDPAGNRLPEPDPIAVVVEESRLPPGPISMKECAYSKNGEISQQYVESISSLICCRKPLVPLASTKQKIFCAALEKVTITETRVAKVVPGRVFSLCWHPSSPSLICAAGDKSGHIGLWDVTSCKTDGQDVVRAFRPHIKPVSDLFFPPADPCKLYSCSWDSTLRCGNFEKEMFYEIFSVPEENDDLLRNISFIDGVHTLLVSQFSGNVSLVDTRTPTTSAEKVYHVSKKSIRTVSVHPTQSQYFITAGTDATIALWDLRSISDKSPKPIQKLEDHTKAISSAYFSPTGHKVLSCSSDNTFLIYSVGNGMKLDLAKRIRHNNYTGRWLTKFQPNWHPTVEDVFVSGSMHRPRQIEVFNADGHLLKALANEEFLASVCSLNVFHPNKACTLVGGNSSGRLHVFM